MNVRGILSVTALAAGLGAVSGTAQAAPAPSYLGPTGYILTPNAEVVPNGCANVGYHYLQLPFIAQGIGPVGSNGFHAPTVNIGIGNRLELGYTRIQGHDNPLTTNLGNAKLSVLGPKSPVMLAGGVLDAWNSAMRTAYVVGQLNVGEKLSSKWIPRTLRVGAGWGTGVFFSPLNGVWVNGAVNPVRAVELHGEWMNNTGVVDTGIRFRPVAKMEGLVLDFAAMDVTGVGGGWHPAGGLSYTMCFGKHKKAGHEEEEAPAKGAAPAGK